ncbi:MAG TPA: substrate-binding domain-containing protein [Chloroflexota bacterium]|nr:substrate-binding domain-containing protein [Chloroflexota bacterium]
MIENRVRARRLRAGLSQGELAEQAGLSRQAIGAVEGGRYVPNTAVALRLGQLLGCRVEDLFALPDALEEREVEIAGAVHSGSQGTPGASGTRAERAERVVVAHARGRWIAHPLRRRRGLQEAFASADAVLPASVGIQTVQAAQTGHTARLLLAPERLTRTALLLGCDPSLGIVSNHMTRLARGTEAGRLAWLEAGSQSALDAVATGTAHLAGSHLLDAPSGEYNLPQARQALAATGGVVVAFARWQQGLVVAPGNPKGLQGVAGLAREDVRLANRESGTGSHALLEALLAAAGVPTTAIHGYASVVASHFEVACVVASGGADAGIAIEAAADVYGLDFIPLAEVRFDFVIPADHLEHPAVALLLDALQTRALRDELRALPGYDVDEIGSIREEIAA